MLFNDVVLSIACLARIQALGGFQQVNVSRVLSMRELLKIVLWIVLLTWTVQIPAKTG
jgi:hypothetical protein